MGSRDWFVTDDGRCEARPSLRDWDLIRERYYFHQFLTDIIAILDDVQLETEQWDRLPQIRLRVRQLITNSYWLRSRYQEPNPKTGIAVLPLYDEIGYPLTVQITVALTGVCSSVHNHGTWGVVAVLQGEEKHRFWRRTQDTQYPDRLEFTGERTLAPGELMSFMPGAIHQAEAAAEQPTVTFELYGDTQPRSRFQFDLQAHAAKPF